MNYDTCQMLPRHEPGESADQPGGTPPQAVRFCSIDGLQKASEAEGWTISYHQMQAGPLEAYSFSSARAGITLLDERASRRLEFIGEPPPGAMTVLVPCSGTQLWLNGLSTGDQGIFLLEPGTDIQCMTSERAHVISMHIPIVQLRNTLQATTRRFVEFGRGRTNLIRSAPQEIARLRHLMYTVIHQPTTKRQHRQQAENLITALSKTIDIAVGSPVVRRRIAATESRRVLSRARDYIEAHLTEPFSIEDICAYCACSVSKLERIYRRELELSPSAYILARRLAIASRRLRNADSASEKIAQVAMELGFNHLGRFADKYRKQFGERPSDTLSASR